MVGLNFFTGNAVYKRKSLGGRYVRRLFNVTWSVHAHRGTLDWLKILRKKSSNLSKQNCVIHRKILTLDHTLEFLNLIVLICSMLILGQNNYNWAMHRRFSMELVHYICLIILSKLGMFIIITLEVALRTLLYLNSVVLQ